MPYNTLFLHLQASCLHLLLLACILPLLFGLLLYWILRQRLQEKFRALEAESAQYHGNWTRTETELAGLKYQNDACVKELERTNAALRSSESENMVLRGRLEQAQKQNTFPNPDSVPPALENTASESSAWANSNPDDLKIVEGIGPKVEQILKAAGIANWNELAVQTGSSLKGILENAGTAYSMMDPSTWPQQAQLAAEARWEELLALQSELRGGRKVD